MISEEWKRKLIWASGVCITYGSLIYIGLHLGWGIAFALFLILIGMNIDQSLKAEARQIDQVFFLIDQHLEEEEEDDGS